MLFNDYNEVKDETIKWMNENKELCEFLMDFEHNVVRKAVYPMNR